MEKSHNIEEVLETLWVRTQEKHEESGRLHVAGIGG